MTFTKPVKLQKTVDFEALVKKYFPHIEWEFIDTGFSLNASSPLYGGIEITGKNRAYGSPDKIKSWFIDNYPHGQGKTLEEAILDWRTKIKSMIAAHYEKKYSFSVVQPIVLGVHYKDTLFVSGMEWEKDVEIPTEK